MTDANYKRINCAHCGVEFTTSRDTKQYCRKACKLAAWRASNPDQVRQHQLDDKRKPNFSPYYAGYCMLCNAPFGSKRKRLVCSRECELTYRRSWAVTLGRRQHAEKALVISCEQCRCAFSPLYGLSHTKLCVPCKDARALIHKQIRRIKRKALQRGATVESVNPAKVFDRDGWRCKLCGIKTPKSKRGTYADDAPELDHIMPLSKGGDHSYRNTQCACRRCNGAKADRPMGQMLLIG